MVAVSSSMMTAADYDAATSVLSIRFSDGDRYRYFDVPESIYRGLIAAPSKGRYFQAFIRERFRYAH